MKLRTRWMITPIALLFAFVLGGIFSIHAPVAPAAAAKTEATATPDPMAGMDMSGGTTADGGMADMAMQMLGMQYMSEEDMTLMMAHMEPISGDNLVQAPNTLGLQPLEFTEEDGFKVFELTARPYLWNILPNVTMVAWTYNGMVPGPLIRVTEGDQVRVVFRNELPEPTTIHWHGLHTPVNMDGVPDVSQPLIQPGETFVYEFTAQPAGTFWYHSHYHEDFQVGLGLHGAFIVDPATPIENPPDVDMVMMLNETRIMGGLTFASMPMSGMEPNYFTINGRSHPFTPPVIVQQGQRVRLRFIGAGQFIHPMHLHGYQFEVVAIDGMPVPEEQRQLMDTISVAPGQRFDIEFVADRTGPWMLQCHIPHHTTNNFRIGMGGLSTFIVVQ